MLSLSESANICNNRPTITKNFTIPQVKCIGTLPYVISKQIEKKTTSVPTHLKKLTAGNNVFSVSVIV